MTSGPQHRGSLCAAAGILCWVVAAAALALAIGGSVKAVKSARR